MTEELKPCPFCGGPAFVERIRNMHWQAKCSTGCDVQMHAPAKKHAIAAWNTRAADPALTREAMVRGRQIVPQHGKRVTDVLKGMLRPALMAGKGKHLVVADWAAVAAWLTKGARKPGASSGYSTTGYRPRPRRVADEVRHP